MAAFTYTTCPVVRDFGRSGYNKDDDDATKGNKGRSGYNSRPNFNNETIVDMLVNSGRSGYNRNDEEKGGRSGYN